METFFYVAFLAYHHVLYEGMLWTGDTEDTSHKAHHLVSAQPHVQTTGASFYWVFTVLLL